MTNKQFLTLIGVATVCVTAIAGIASCVNTIVTKVLDSKDSDFSYDESSTDKE